MDAITTPAIDRVRGTERIASLDVIRGFAILFILFMNIPGMGNFDLILRDGRYPTWTPADWWSTLIVNTTLEGTQRGLLELLFGAGIMIMARRAMDPDGPVEVADLHFRRNLLLIALGLFNAFVLMWWGDILLTYGIAAMFLFPARRWSARAQLGTAAIFFAAIFAHSAIDYQKDVRDAARLPQLQQAEARHQKLSDEDKELLKDHREAVQRTRLLPAQNPDMKDKIAKGLKAHHSTFAAYWTAQAEGWNMLMGWFWIIEAEIVGTMLVGMALYRLGLIQGRGRTSTYAIMLVVGYGLGFWLRGSMWLEILNHQLGPRWQEMFNQESRLLVTFGHLGLIHLIRRSSAGQALLRPFQAAGRMPLSVYLFTSFLMMWVVFAPWGLGWWGRYGAAGLTLIAAIVIAGELVAANLWMRRFECGPFEWVWKSLAYLRREPFRRPVPLSAGAAPQMQPAE